MFAKLSLGLDYGFLRFLFYVFSEAPASCDKKIETNFAALYFYLC